MKNTILLVLSFIIMSCDAPQTLRDQPTQYANTGGSFSSGTDSYSDNSSGQEGTSGTTTTTTSAPDVTASPGFEDCDLGIQYNGGTIGNFGICQSTQSESLFKAIFSNTDTSVGTCFVPVHISGTTSFKLGIAQCVHNVAERTYDVPLYKDRAEAINGVMVIKASSLNSYMQCMNAKANYINSIPGCAYNQQCVTAATNYANQICSSFISYHSSNYKQVQF